MNLDHRARELLIRVAGELDSYRETTLEKQDPSTPAVAGVYVFTIAMSLYDIQDDASLGAVAAALAAAIRNRRLTVLYREDPLTRGLSQVSNHKTGLAVRYVIEGPYVRFSLSGYAA